MPLSSDQAIAVVSELLVPAYVNEHPLTKGVIASIPADKAAYKPEDVARRALGKVKALDGEQLLKPIDFRGIFNFPAYAYLQSGLSHSIHHRGQLSTNLRPMGGRVPSIYGESYDSRQNRERQA